VDVLSDLLGRARAHGAVFALSHLRGDWGVALDGLEGLTVHVITSGEAVLTVEGDTRARLAPGDVVLVRPNLAHQLTARASGPTQSLAELEVFRRPGSDEFDVPGDGPPTDLLCGAYRLDTEICAGLLAHLPDVVHLRARDRLGSSTVRSVVDLMADELVGSHRGRSSVLDRLLDVVVVVVLRSWFEESGEAPAWYLALADADVGRALERLHEDPARRWTVESLAHEVGVSRATLARRFTQLVGVPPSTYLTTWRLQLAAQELRSGSASIRSIARAVGYDNEFSFSTAFRRYHGSSPSRYRASAVARAGSGTAIAAATR
jgi:AraC-like DNA-binding protein